MRTFVRYPAVVIPLALLVVLVCLPGWGQYKINTFDKAVKDSQFVVVYNASATATDPKPYHTITDDAAVKREGAASLKNAWRVHATETWGGMNMLSTTLPTKTDSGYYAKNYRAMYGDSTFMDWSAGTAVSLWYNNTKPSTASGNGVQMRLHIYEAGGQSKYYAGNATDYEDWYFQSAKPINDTVPGWHQLVMPLLDNGTIPPDDKGFTLPGWSGTANNSKLDLDRIIGYTIEWTAGKLPGDTANGIVFYDDLRLEGLGKKTGYEPFYSFNNYGKDTTNFASGWTNGGLSSFTFFEEKTDTLLGPSNLGCNWAINAKESWGGGSNKEYNLPAGTFMGDLSAKTTLQFYIKVIQPVTSSKGTIGNKITLRFVLFDYSDSQKEEWYTVANVRLDSMALKMGWQQVKIPLEWIQSGDWGQLKTGRFNTPNGTKDGVLAWNKIGGMKLEFSCSADAGEPNSDAALVYSGKVIFSAIIPSGYRETDKTPPAAVASVQATKQTYANIITWADVPSETGSTYNVYASEKSFTKTTDAGVENIPPFGLPLGTQLATHLLLYPKVNQNVAFYYGVTATDKAGNVNQPTVIGPITNLAKGVPTIAMTTLSNFAADGSLTEWASVPPINLTAFGANPTAFIVGNTTITNDADLSGKAYLAADNNYLYVAFDVTDNIISIDTSAAASSWLQDSPDLFIGLYDWRGWRHTSYQRGKTPDYHLRFSQNKVIVDNAGGATLVAPGANYKFYVNPLTAGYTVEARIPWGAFRTTVSGDSLFSPIEGMRIPIDIEISDNDTPGNNSAREGQLDYSSMANGNSYADVWRWTYTWLGNKASTTGVEEQQTLPLVYSLEQNYPNPFNPSTVIKYSLANSGAVTLKVFDVLGREVGTLVNGEVQNAGNHQVTFGSTSLRTGVSSGVYFYRLESGSFRDVKKMVLLK